MNFHLFSIFLIIFHLSITSAGENDDDITNTLESNGLSSTILPEVSSHEESTDSLLLVSAKAEVDEQNSTLETTSVVIVKSISNEQIEAEMTRLKDLIRSYDADERLQEHPMIAHFRKMAQAYTICCKRYETLKVFNLYIQHMGKGIDDYDSIYNMLRICEKRRYKSPTLHDVQQQCSAVISDVSTALLTRQEYMKKFKKELNSVFEKHGHYFDLNEEEHTTISNEDPYVTKYCLNEDAIELMFDFNKLLTCEELIRQHLHSSPDEYNLYTKNYSEPFQNMISAKWERIRTIIDYLNSPHILQSGEQIIKLNTVSGDRISSGMKAYRIALNIQDVKLQYSDHPLITYLSKRAHAYAVCCKPYEIREMFNQYLDNFYANHDADNLLNQIIAKCHRNQVHQFTSEFSKKCDIAYDDVLKAANQRKQFFRDHENRYPDMESRFNEMFSINSDMQKEIISEKAYVDEYCPNIHIMELIYDIGELVECEKSIRYGLSSSPEKYETYETGVSNRFRRYIGVHFGGMVGYIGNYPQQVISTSIVTLSTNSAVPAPIATPTKTPENAAVVSKEQIESDMETYRNALRIDGMRLQYPDHPLITYLSKRAHVYAVCCKPFETRGMFNQYLDNFYANQYNNSLGNKIIAECHEKQIHQFTSQLSNKCHNAYDDVLKAANQRKQFFRDHEKRYPDMKSRFTKIFSINSNMKKLINTERTYVDALCPNIHIMELIFDIGKLEDCEKSIRYGLSSFPEKYITYEQHVSGFFKAIIVNNWQQLTRFIRIFPIQVVSTSTITLPTNTPVPTTIATPIKKHENAAIVSNEQIEFGINNTKNRLKNSGYNEIHDHPMIAHFPKLAHAYTSCCKTNETPDMLKTYLDNVDTYSHRSYTLLTLILNCPFTTDHILNAQCNAAYSHLVQSREAARRFADEYAKQHPDEKTKLEDSIHPEKINFDNIEAVHKYVKKYCPNDHVIELLFNLEKYLKCEESIRYGLQSSLNDYQSYGAISSEFANKIDNSWRLMSSHVKSLKKTHKQKTTPITKTTTPIAPSTTLIVQTATPIVFSATSTAQNKHNVKKLKPDHSSPNKISQSQNHVAAISSSGISIYRMIYQYFTLSFIILILKISF